jgi:hypothetical protein
MLKQRDEVGGDGPGVALTTLARRLGVVPQQINVYCKVPDHVTMNGTR